MTVRFKGIEFELGGDIYVVPPIALGDLEVLQDRLAKFEEFRLDSESARLIADVAHRALRRNYPDMTLEQVSELVDVGNATELLGAVMDVSGMRRREIEAGKTPAASQAKG